MPNDTPENAQSPGDQSPAKTKLGFLSRLLPRTVAGKAAWVTAVVLLLTLVGVWAYRRFGPDSVRLLHAITWTQMLIEFTLVVIIPAILYWGIRRWNQVIEGVYPDIDKAWQAGMDAFEAQGISVAELPIFLVLGSPDHQVEHGLIAALETEVRVDGIPNEPGIRHALQWYACTDAIYLFCPGASSLSTLLGRWSPPARSGSGRTIPVTTRPSVPAPTERPPRKTPPGSVVVDAQAEPPSAPTSSTSPAPAAGTSAADASAESRPTADKYLGTIQFPTVDQSPAPASDAGSGIRTPRPTAGDSQTRPSSTRSIGPTPGEPAQYMGTVSADQLPSRPAAPFSGQTSPPQSTGSNQGGHPAVAPDRGAAATASPQPSASPQAGGGTAASDAAPALTPARRFAASNVALPAALDTSDQIPRLQYVCKLIRRVRRPRCGVNGIVTLIPFELSAAGPLQLSALSQSARGDVSTVQETLGIRSPVTAVLVGLEQDRGFTELVRRLQPELLSRRLGGRFDLRSRPTPEELNAHSDRLCDAFEDWVYRLFGREDALAQQRGNRKLYGLISRIRHELKPRLRIVLGQAFGCEPTAETDTADGDRSFFFSGCYFAAIGLATGQPAFVKGVMQDKLIDEQSQVQWTVEALRRHARFRSLAILGWAVCGLLAALLLAKWLGLFA